MTSVKTVAIASQEPYGRDVIVATRACPPLILKPLSYLRSIKYPQQRNSGPSFSAKKGQK
ncbi:hypothetical protein AEM38_14330 [Hyphomonadaceae bacterium UKL13-1]|nr:hypothetical protein AEM38_14330 [Hyphomonadaceae bacterium UKL13-1]